MGKPKIKSKYIGIHTIEKGIYLVDYIICHLDYGKFYIYSTLRVRSGSGSGRTFSLNSKK